MARKLNTHQEEGESPEAQDCKQVVVSRSHSPHRIPGVVQAGMPFLSEHLAQRWGAGGQWTEQGLEKGSVGSLGLSRA